MSKGKNKDRFWIGLITGSSISLLSAIIVSWVQHSFTLKEKTTQLYLDEKRDFVIACDAYLGQYRQWHEIMNYLTYYKDSSIHSQTSEFKTFEEAVQAYRQWKKEVDFAYGKIHLLSDNEFGIKTLEVSTVLHGSLADLFNNNYDLSRKQKTLEEVDKYFFENWLMKAQEEIFRFNSGTRKQKSLTEFFEEQRLINQKRNNDDSVNLQLYQNLLMLYKYQSKQDSLNGRKSRNRMPTKEEFDQFVNPKN